MPRARRPKDKESVFETLKNGEDKHNFRQYSHIFIFAACLGYWKQRRIPFVHTLDQIDWGVFEEKEKEAMKMIALKVTEDPGILLDNESKLSEVLKIVEEYANGGLEIIQNEVLLKEKQGGDRISLLTDLLMQPNNEGKTKEDILTQMIG